MHQKQKGSALVITLFIAMILSIVALTTIEKIMPISRSTKGIENGNTAYYLAYSGVENALALVDKTNPGVENTFGGNFGGVKSGKYNLSALTSTVPLVWEGNSEYGDGKWNRISQNEPLELLLPTTLNSSNLSVTFRIPNVSPSGEVLAGNSGSGVVLWSLTSNSFQGYSSGELGMVTTNEINNASAVSVAGKLGFIPTTEQSTSFSNVFASNCTTGTGCALKFSLVRPLALSSPVNTSIPYLEYQININGGQKIPNQYATISAQGDAAGFSQAIIRHVRQKTSVTGTEFATVN